MILNEQEYTRIVTLPSICNARPIIVAPYTPTVDAIDMCFDRQIS